jgi:signal transduction histidine kinase
MKPASAAGFAPRIRLSSPRWLWWLLVWALVGWSCALHVRAQSPAVDLPVPTVSLTQTIARLELSPGLQSPALMAQGHWQQVDLPHAWYHQDWCAAPQSTYRFTFNWTDTGDPHGLAMLIHRAGNRVGVWVNQQHVAQFGSFDNPDADYTNFPLLVRMPWHLLQAEQNTVYIQVVGDCRRFSGLSQIEIGPFSGVSAQHTRDTDLLVYPIIVVITLCAIMFVAGLVYVRLSPSSAQARGLAWLNGIWALGSALWTLRDLPMPYWLWYCLVDMCYAMWILLSARMTMQLTSTLTPWIVRLQTATISAYFLATISAALGYAIALKPITMVWALAVYSFLVVRIIYHSIKAPSETRAIICLTIVPMTSIGAIDSWNLWMSQEPMGYQTYYFSPVVSFLMLMSLGLLIMRQFQQAMRSDKQYQHSLELEVERQRTELALHYQHEQEQAQLAAVQAERQRIVRDMHDGLGSQLVGMLAALRSDKVEPVHLENEIAQAMEHLRATMDNLSNTEQDLSTVLAQFRFHHEPRLLRAGLHLRWRVQTLPPTPWSPAATWEMQQMLREVFANILKHAEAKHITVAAGCHDGVCSIQISDDGKGFDMSQNSIGRGLKHLKERAQHLGVQLDIQSQVGQGTRVEWRWAEGFVPKHSKPSV